MRIKVGDRVRTIKSRMFFKKDAQGVVVEERANGGYFMVKFDKSVFSPFSDNIWAVDRDDIKPIQSAPTHNREESAELETEIKNCAKDLTGFIKQTELEDEDWSMVKQQNVLYGDDCTYTVEVKVTKEDKE